MKFPGSHIISIEPFDRSDIERIFEVADQMVPYAHRQRISKVLDGAILGSMFFEPSTRTRVSFGSAFNLLGGRFARPSALPLLRSQKASHFMILQGF